jgi:hypothetical protein
MDTYTLNPIRSPTQIKLVKTKADEDLQFLGALSDTEPVLVEDLAHEPKGSDLDPSAKTRSNTVKKSRPCNTRGFKISNVLKNKILIQWVSALFDDPAITLQPSTDAARTSTLLRTQGGPSLNATPDLIHPHLLSVGDHLTPAGPLTSLPSRGSWSRQGTFSDIETTNHLTATDTNFLRNVTSEPLTPIFDGFEPSVVILDPDHLHI